MTGVLIVGSGFSGLGMAIALRRAGRDDFVVIEKGTVLGGTWRDNTYPGCACDVPSHLYSYSFEPNPDWSHVYAPQPEIQEYLLRCAEKYQIKVEYGRELATAAFDEDTDEWAVTTTDGHAYRATALVLAIGALHVPAVPELPGADRFAGPAWHSARWRHDVDPAGKRVAVIGTGASAAQFVPELAKIAEHVDVYQRTPPWILPRGQERVRDVDKARYHRQPGALRRRRRGIYWRMESQAVGFTWPRLMALAEIQARRHLHNQVSDPELRAKLTPTYRMGCKRVLFSNDYYPALAGPRVDLITTPIAEITADGVRTADGTDRPADALVYGTGFEVVTPLGRLDIVGRGGRRLADAWRSGAEAYLGTVVAGFPNLFMLLGPNTGLGHNSIVFMVEQQIGYVLRALREAAPLDVRPDVQAAYNRGLHARLRRAVWSAGGCRSWYLDADGVNRTLWPGFSWRYATRMRRFRRSDFR